ncbi:metallophosphoesterase [Paenibacillus sp. WQ 127069]|uniref:Metallophosphoesterase n=1 Tax=Paenibacillus baimaensis TaxID=2982185 RepID=A0ABT2US51_9BACL|nr:metallophosphoesterase [Paenibacillus sp. WQ 127069]MCU6797503.1 metallophosphoesterase [Paenibacillus sp. WQ 127069]
MLMIRVLAVSDIHGYGHLLERLLEHAGYDACKDRLFLLGDYVNKGPDSLGTLSLVRKLTQAGALAIQGNNERKWLRSASLPAHDGSDGIGGYGEFLSNLPLWAEYEPFLFVHAGLRPGVPMIDQTAEDLTEIRELFHASSPEAGRIVVFGHTSTFRFGLSPERVWLGNGKIGIDTGAGHGYFVSLVDLTNGIQWYISVKQPHIIEETLLSQ